MILLSATALSAMLTKVIGGGALGTAVYTFRHKGRSKLSKRLGELFRACNLGIKTEEATIYPAIMGEKKLQENETHFLVALPAGLSKEDLETKRYKFNYGVNGEVQFFNDDDGYVRLEVLTGKLPRMVEWRPEALEKVNDPDRLLLYLGESRRGAVTVDLAEVYNILIGGEIGGGKSGAERLIITELLLSHSPADLQMYMIDLKGGVELGRYGNLPNVEVVWDGTDAVNGVLETINTEIDRRYALLRETGTTNIHEYRRVGERLPYIVVVFDEFRELSPSEGDKRKSAGQQSEQDKRNRAHAQVSRIAALGRACGVHIILATQRPDANVLPGLIKANFTTTLAFRVRNQVNSKILLDSDSACQIDRVPGRCILQTTDEEQVQVAYMSPQMAQELLGI